MNAKIEKQLSTVANPLELIWRQGGYYVDKPDDRTGEYVSKEVAQGMLEALREISKAEGPYDMDRFRHAQNVIKNMVEIANEAISKATQP